MLTPLVFPHIEYCMVQGILSGGYCPDTHVDQRATFPRIHIPARDVVLFHCTMLSKLMMMCMWKMWESCNAVHALVLFQSCPRVGLTRGLGRIGSGHDFARFWWDGSGQHRVLSLFTIISWFLNRYEFLNTTFGWVVFLRYLIYIINHATLICILFPVSNLNVELMK